MESEANLVNEVMDMSDIIDEIDYDKDLIDPLSDTASDEFDEDFDDDEDEEDEEFDESEGWTSSADFPEEDPTTFEYVQSCIDLEGFHYAFADYSNYEEVADPEFHKLRELYLLAAENLQKYIKDNIK